MSEGSGHERTALQSPLAAPAMHPAVRTALLSIVMQRSHLGIAKGGRHRVGSVGEGRDGVGDGCSGEMEG